jgi:creatinine amidohydrolase
MPATYLADLSGSRLSTAISQAQLAILPLGSVEYHGPHGALGTDLFLAETLARRVGDGLDALVLPPVPFSHCPPATRSYRGTLNIAEETLVRYLEEIVAGVFDLGVQGMLVLNAHDGNIRPIRMAGDHLAERYPSQFLLAVNWWEALPNAALDELGFFSQGRGHGHGGPLEISAADAARPGTADWNAAYDLDLVEPPGGRVIQAINQGRPLPNWQGFHGRASEGSLEKGERLLELATEQIIALTREWLDELMRPF